MELYSLNGVLSTDQGENWSEPSLIIGQPTTWSEQFIDFKFQYPPIVENLMMVKQVYGIHFLTIMEIPGLTRRILRFSKNRMAQPTRQLIR